MATVNEAECRAAGVDPRAVLRIARRLERAAKEAKALGLVVFGGSGSGDLRKADTDLVRQGCWSGLLIVAELDGGSWDGGDGSHGPGPDGLTRGEA